MKSNIFTYSQLAKVEIDFNDDLRYENYLSFGLQPQQ